MNKPTANRLDPDIVIVLYLVVQGKDKGVRILWGNNRCNETAIKKIFFFSIKTNDFDRLTMLCLEVIDEDWKPF